MLTRNKAVIFGRTVGVAERTLSGQDDRSREPRRRCLAAVTTDIGTGAISIMNRGTAIRAVRCQKNDIHGAVIVLRCPRSSSIMAGVATIRKYDTRSKMPGGRIVGGSPIGYSRSIRRRTVTRRAILFDKRIPVHMAGRTGDLRDPSAQIFPVTFHADSNIILRSRLMRQLPPGRMGIFIEYGSIVL
jgi:hypothetical protein